MTSKARANISSPLAEGVRQHRAGNLAAAERCYRAVKRRDPNHAESLRLRGLLARQRGDAEAALALLRRAAKRDPANPVAHHTLAEVLRASGQVEAAIGPYRRARRLDPERAETGLDLADTLAEAGASEHALQVYAELRARWPNLAAAHARAARLLFERGAPGAARELLSVWQAQAPQDAASRHALAAAWTDIGEYAHAEAIHRAQIADDPNAARAHAQLGGIQQSRGHFADAAASFEHALAIDRGQAWVYAALMSDRRYELSDARLGAMRALLADERTDAESRLRLHFALGQWHERSARHADAFAHFEQGNRIQAELTPFDAHGFDARIERIIDYFGPRALADAGDHGVTSDKPIFIVGMPRSGTSLVEQILASHPDIHGAGELDDMRRAVRELPWLAGDGRRFPQCLDRVAQSDLRALGQRYLGALDARAPNAARVTDKMPFNMLWLGLIARLFPNARVIYCRRAALDNCLSCYFQWFSRGLRFTYDLDHLARVYAQHERLMAHWAAHLPLAMYTVEYESLVADRETGIRRLVEFAGVPWDPACLDFHRAARAVRTASIWQVRQPVYQSSVERWRAYEPWLAPLQQALAQAHPVPA